MRIFLSHSSKHKPLVRELIHYLPDHVRPWIDERQLLIGDGISSSIQQAISVGTDFVVLFVDTNSATSAWVRKEIEWALQHERILGRTFVLPIVLELDAWPLIEPADFRERKYLSCIDFSEDGIRTLGQNLTSQLFAWVSRDGQKNSDRLPAMDLLQEAETYLSRLAAMIRTAVQKHDRSSPLRFCELLEQLRADPNLKVQSDGQMRDALFRLRQHGYLAGLVCARDHIFVEEAYYGWKTTLFTEEKSRIAKKAIEFIDSHSVVVLDAGSTTIRIAEQICEGIKLRAWEYLTVVTNSLSAAHDMLMTAEEVGLEDTNNVIQVYVTGGRVRCNTLAIVPVGSTTTTDFDQILDSLGGAAVCFVGANGIDWEYGFTTHDNPEIKTKKAMLNSSRQKFIVADRSKFTMKQPHVFAPFTQDLQLITTEPDNHADAAYDSELRKHRISLIYA